MSWVLDLSMLSIFVCIYMFGWFCRATCSFVSTSMFGISHAIQNEKKLWNLHIPGKVIGEILVLGLLVVVYKISYSSCMWTRQDVIGVLAIVLLSIWCNVCACHSPVYHYIAATVVYLVQRIIVKLSINNHIVRLVHKKHIIRTCLMYHAACKVEFQPFKRSYSQLTFFNFL